MEKSLNFIKNRIESGMCSGMNISDYKNAFEFNFIDFINICNENIKKSFCNNQFTTIMSGECNGIEGKSANIIVFDPDADFEYFTMESCSCDGTLLFMNELMEDVLSKIFGVRTYNTQTIPTGALENIWNYDIKYTVGNFVLNNENGKFGTEEKPWMQSRFTAMLPIKCEWILKG